MPNYSSRAMDIAGAYSALEAGRMSPAKGGAGIYLSSAVQQATGGGGGAGTTQVGPFTVQGTAPASVEPQQAGLGLLAPLLGLIPGGVGGALAGLLGIGGAVVGGAQALGFGEGGGLFNNNLLGGPDEQIPGTDITIGGPGLAEPGPGTGWNLLKELSLIHI